jgi:DNA repair exonuclease SbcCD ATPase subunit
MSQSDWYKAELLTQLSRRRDKEIVDGMLAAEVTKYENLQFTKADLATVAEATKALAMHCQMQAKATLEQFVTRCLADIFPENRYRFRLVYERKRDQSEVRFVLVDGEGNEYDPLRANGGGVVDIIAFALRLATIVLSKPKPAQVLILDEPFRFLSAEHRERVASLLDSLASELGFQFIMVTHIPELARGNVVEL